jgi:hypothetical protein
MINKRFYSQILRLAVQCVVTALIIMGFTNLLRGMGLPQYIFVPLVIMAGVFYCGW